MIHTFLSHISKRFFRSSSADKELAVQIMLGFIVFVVVGYSLAIGFSLEWIIVTGLKQNNPLTFLNGLLIYYFIGELITRYFMQNLPAWDVHAYMHLPISRSRIVNFLLCRSMLHVINTFVILLFSPFALSVVANAYGTLHAWIWLLSLWFVSMINHFIVVLVKQKLANNAWGLLVFIVICITLVGSDYLGWYKLSIISEKIFSTALHDYVSLGVLLLLVLVLYVSAYRLFISKLYPEELSFQENRTFHSAEWTFLQNFGLIGKWINLELKLIFRNKRSREIFLLNVVFFFNALILYNFARSQSSYGVFLSYGIIGSGFFMLYYGQFLFSWQGQHFDFTLAQPTSIRLFVESKYWFLTSITGLWFLFSIPFVYIGWHIVLVNFVATLYNLGINMFLTMNMSMWGAKTIDLRHAGSLNYEGMGAAQWVMLIPFTVSPYLFYLPFSLMGYPILGLVFVGIAGLVGIVFRKQFIDITSRRLSNMRYVLASNFRNE
ncbi:MAG: DUF5687 family protein [Cyclobacteriaceae bacterium]